MDPHRVEILNGAHNGHIVVGVAQQFQLKLLPPQKCLVNHHFVDGAEVKTTLKFVLEGLFVIHHSGSCAAQSVRRTNAQRITELLCHFLALQKTLRCGLRCHRDINLAHQLSECFAILSDVDGFGVHTNHPHVVLLPNAHFFALDGQVEGSLSTHGRQHGINVGVLLEN